MVTLSLKQYSHFFGGRFFREISLSENQVLHAETIRLAVDLTTTTGDWSCQTDGRPAQPGDFVVRVPRQLPALFQLRAGRFFLLTRAGRLAARSWRVGSP